MKTLAVALLLLPAAHAMEKLQGSCYMGAQRITVSGHTSSNFALQGFRSCTVKVFISGTTNLATIFSDNASTAKANPFVADVQGDWFFYAANGRYSVQFSGSGIPAPFTRADYLLNDGGGGGAATWGSITGTLSAQTDLQNALNAKQNSLGFTAENAANKDAASGYAGLDSGTKLKLTEFPSTVALTTQANTYSGGGLQDLSGMKLKPPTSTVAGLPSAAANTNVVYEVTDGTSVTDCTTGGGTTRGWCASNGAAWNSLAASVAGAALNAANTYTGGGLQDFSAMKFKPPTSTTGALPSAAANTNVVYEVTNGATVTDCTAGGGTNRVWCASNGTAWVAMAGTGGGSAISIQVSTTTVGTRSVLNFLNGTGLTWSCADNPVNLSVDCTPAFNTALIPTHTTIHNNENFLSSTTGTTTYAASAPNLALPAYVKGQVFTLLVDTTCAAACTLNVNVLGAKSIKQKDGTTDPGGALVASQPQLVYYDGTLFRLMY